MRKASDLKKAAKEYYYDGIKKIFEMIAQIVDSDEALADFIAEHSINLDKEIAKEISVLEDKFPDEHLYELLNEHLAAFEWRLCSLDGNWYVEPLES